MTILELAQLKTCYRYKYLVRLASLIMRLVNVHIIQIYVTKYFRFFLSVTVWVTSDRKIFLGISATMFLQISLHETNETRAMKKLVKMRYYTTNNYLRYCKKCKHLHFLYASNNQKRSSRKNGCNYPGCLWCN